MVSRSRILCRRVMWGLLLAILVLPAARPADAARPAQPVEIAIDAVRSTESGATLGGPTILAPGLPDLPGGPGGGGPGGPNLGPEEGDPDDFGCRPDIRMVEFLVTEVYLMMWL